MDNEINCRGCLRLGSGCGLCLRCKAEAFDWLVSNLRAVDSFAVMTTGRHDVMDAVKAVIQERRSAKKRCVADFRND